MSRNPLDYAKVLTDRVTGRSADVLNDTVLEYGAKGGKSKSAASTPKPDYREGISSPTKKFIDVFLNLHYVGKTKEFFNAIRFFYSGAPGDAGDKKWIQFASRQIIFENASKKWTPAKLTSVDTAARDAVPVTQGSTILWNVDSSNTTDPHYSFEVEYTSDNSGVQMVDSPSFPASGFPSSAEDLYGRYNEGEKVSSITLMRTMKTYLLKSEVAVWGCSWTSTIVCRLDSTGWWPDSNVYKINKSETGFVTALGKDHAAVLLVEYKGSTIR